MPRSFRPFAHECLQIRRISHARRVILNYTCPLFTRQFPATRTREPRWEPRPRINPSSICHCFTRQLDREISRARMRYCKDVRWNISPWISEYRGGIDVGSSRINSRDSRESIYRNVRALAGREAEKERGREQEREKEEKRACGFPIHWIVSYVKYRRWRWERNRSDRQKEIVNRVEPPVFQREARTKSRTTRDSCSFSRGSVTIHRRGGISRAVGRIIPSETQRETNQFSWGEKERQEDNEGREK